MHLGKLASFDVNSTSVLFQIIFILVEDCQCYYQNVLSTKLFVNFDIPRCGHCKKLKPDYAKAAEDLVRNDPPVYLAKVDCTGEGKSTCSKYNVGGYPTLKIFRGGEFSAEYDGPRATVGIVKHMKLQVGPSSKELQSVSDFDNFLQAENDVSVVGFFEKESDLKATFLKLADKLRDKVRFAHSSFQDVLAKQGVSDGVVLFHPQHLANKFEEASVAYSGSVDKSQLNDFITQN